MELYYFIGVIEYYNNNKKYGENYVKKNSKLFSENIQIILKLFLYCLSELNPKQEKENKENIEQFFYTLNNLINLKSKTDFKIEYKFLIAISGYIHLLLKNINFCGFILDCQYYDLNDDKTLELLFQTILVDFEKHYSELFSKEIFTKILNFDKIFTQNNLKQCRKPYSVLIQNILNKIINENKIDCFTIYIQKIIDSQIKNTPSSYLYDNIDEEDIREEENENNILANNRKKLSLISNASSNLSINYNKLDDVEKELADIADDVRERKFMQGRKKYYINGGEIEIVKPIDNSKFCANCSRLRITPDGKIKPCLLRNDNLVELISHVRNGESEEELEKIFINGINKREPFNT
jgi:hypothetical protein